MPNLHKKAAGALAEANSWQQLGKFVRRHHARSSLDILQGPMTTLDYGCG